MGKRLSVVVIWLAGVLAMANFAPAFAQANVDCGVADSIDYPIEGVSIEHDDFSIYRAGFNGYHTGIDMAFGRYGDAVRAAARGRVTFSDPEGWDTEKGVVVLEHKFPDGSTVFTLYGHMEQVNGHTFPRVGLCIERGQIVGAIGSPANSAPHLHYEIRRMRASTGGPGYWSVDPLSGGWMHPIEFTEQWQLRFSRAFRQIVTASDAPTSVPLWMPDGSALFAASSQLELRTASGPEANAAGQTVWKLAVEGLVGIMRLSDGRVLGRTLQNRVYVFDNDRFAAAWQPDRPLRTPPLRLGSGESVVFLDNANRAVAYTADGALRWQSEPLGARIEHYAVSGALLAVAADEGGTHRLRVVNAEGQLAYEAAAPAPIVPIARESGGFLILVASQVNLLMPDLTLIPLLDTGQALGRGSRAALDAQGNVFVFPGQGQYIYAYAPGGGLRWRARLPALPMRPPLLGVGAGCLVYALTSDGALLAYRADDGALRGIAALYAGGPNHRPAARFLRVLPGEQVQFSAGYLSVVTLDGPTLANMGACG